MLGRSIAPGVNKRPLKFTDLQVTDGSEQEPIKRGRGEFKNKLNQNIKKKKKKSIFSFNLKYNYFLLLFIYFSIHPLLLRIRCSMLPGYLRFRFSGSILIHLQSSFTRHTNMIWVRKVKGTWC